MKAITKYTIERDLNKRAWLGFWGFPYTIYKIDADGNKRFFDLAATKWGARRRLYKKIKEEARPSRMHVIEEHET